MVAFLSPGLGLGHKDFDGYRVEVHQGSLVATGFGRGRRIWLSWPERP